MDSVERTAAEAEGHYHHYSGNAIPWYVRLMWIAFWTFAILYAIRFLIPSLQLELFQRQ
jgi:hypothetical protein